MAFGRKKEEKKLTPMAGYQDHFINIVQNCVTGNREHISVAIRWEKLTRISIDKITMAKEALGSTRPLILHSKECEGDYLRAWRKGLGKFIVNDFRYLENLEKYNLIGWTEDTGLQMFALIREVDFDDKVPSETFDDLIEYNAISFQFHDESNNIHYFQIIKVFPYAENLNDISIHLGAVTEIRNAEDPYSERTEETNTDAPDNGEPMLISENELTEDYINQVSLF